jgi:hypothetical protein
VTGGSGFGCCDGLAVLVAVDWLDVNPGLGDVFEPALVTTGEVGLVDGCDSLVVVVVEAGAVFEDHHGAVVVVVDDVVVDEVVVDEEVVLVDDVLVDDSSFDATSTTPDIPCPPGPPCTAQ